jgi:drug/metabolite transporter (DMT)-like permease
VAGTGNAKHPLTLLTVQLLFGLFPVASKLALADGLGPFPILAVRLAGAAFCMLVLHLLLVRNPIPIRAEWKNVLGLSLLGVVLNMGFFMVGINFTTPVNAVVVLTTIPVFTYGIAVALRRETLAPRRALGIALALAGAGFLLFTSYQASWQHAMGDLLVMLNALSYAAFLVLARPMTQRYDPLSLTTWMLLVGAVVFVPVGFALGLRGQLAAASSGTMGWLVFIILGATVVTYTLNTKVLRHVPASTVAIFTYIQPVFTAVAAYLVLHAPLDVKVLPAAAAVFAGVWLVAKGNPKIIEGETVVE